MRAHGEAALTALVLALLIAACSFLAGRAWENAEQIEAMQHPGAIWTEDDEWTEAGKIDWHPDGSGFVQTGWSCSSSNQILRWDAAGDEWVCAADEGGAP